MFLSRSEAPLEGLLGLEPGDVRRRPGERGSPTLRVRGSAQATWSVTTAGGPGRIGDVIRKNFLAISGARASSTDGLEGVAGGNLVIAAGAPPEELERVVLRLKDVGWDDDQDER